MTDTNIDLQDMTRRLYATYPGGYISRDEAQKVFSGALSARYYANLDSQGKGVPGRIRFGRKVLYPIDALVQWMGERAHVCEGVSDE